jgi:hypothetical protein
LVEVLGRGPLIDVLKNYAAKPWQFPRWLWFGAPPLARERLRWLGAVNRTS